MCCAAEAEGAGWGWGARDTAPTCPHVCCAAEAKGAGWGWGAPQALTLLCSSSASVQTKVGGQGAVGQHGPPWLADLNLL